MPAPRPGRHRVVEHDRPLEAFKSVDVGGRGFRFFSRWLIGAWCHRRTVTMTEIGLVIHIHCFRRLRG